MFQFLKNLSKKSRKPEAYEAYFARKEDYLLTSEERASLADFIIKFPEVWKIQKKYFYGEVNTLSRQLAICKPEELDGLQKSMERTLKPIRDFELIKENYLKESKKQDKVQPVKDMMYYVTNRDVRDSGGKIRLSGLD